MRAQRPVLADRYVVHLPVDLGDATSRFVGTNVTTGQPVIIAVVSAEWARFELNGTAVAHRNLATLIEVIQHPESGHFPIGAELPKQGSALVAELIRGKSLYELLRDGPLHADRAVAWTIRILEGLGALHVRDHCHGALSSPAVVAEPAVRPIAPVLSKAVVPPLRDYASLERVLGEGPSVSDDLWAVGVLLFEMLTGKRPFDARAVASGKAELATQDLAFLKNVPHGRELEVVLRRALSSQSRRFLTAPEFIESLDAWERRVAVPRMAPARPSRQPILPTGRGPAPWDPIVDEFTYGTKRVEATFDAAEQMRQSVVAGDGPSIATAPPHAHKPAFPMVASPAGGDATSQAGRKPNSQAPKPPTPKSAVANPQALKQGAFSPDNSKSVPPKSGAPKSRRRFSSIGPEMAAFAERSRPKLKPWLFAFGVFVVTTIAGVARWSRIDDRGLVGKLSEPASDASEVKMPQSSMPVQPKLSAREEASLCIRSYFREGAVKGQASLEFVCTEEDFLGAARHLQEDSMAEFVVASNDAGTPIDSTLASPGSSGAVVATAVSTAAAAPTQTNPEPRNPALVVRSGTMTRGWQLGWYDLVATAIIRQNCCREAAPIRLPETTGWCQQLQTVVRRIASDSAKVGDISPGVRTFDEAINCLMAQGKHVVYPYKAVPTSQQKSNFQQFLKHAAEVDAKRSARR